MNIQRMALLVGAVVVLAGIFGLMTPVSISDGEGATIGCGNAVVQDTSAARTATERQLTNLPVVKEFVSQTDYVSECNTAVAQRRWWAIPVTVIGLVVALGSTRIRSGAHSSATSAP